jgi:hypothetical protein
MMLRCAVVVLPRKSFAETAARSRIDALLVYVCVCVCVCVCVGVDY